MESNERDEIHKKKNVFSDGRSAFFFVCLYISFDAKGHYPNNVHYAS